MYRDMRNNVYQMQNYSQAPPKSAHYPSTQPKKGKGLIVLGVVLFIIGLAVAGQPLTWKNMEEITEDWEGSNGYGYYRSYDEGDQVTVSGEIVYKALIRDILDDSDGLDRDDINYFKDLMAQGYEYGYLLDNPDAVDDLYSKEDVGDEGDNVFLVLSLRIMNLGGDDYWIWTVNSETSPMAFYAPGTFVILLAFLLIAGSTWRASRSGKRAPYVQKPPPVHYQFPLMPPPPPMNLVGAAVENKFCIFCGKEIINKANFCIRCGRRQPEHENVHGTPPVSMN
ncbi:MAG: zinc ribbon domain-containing protein [Thermoplasmata archaeon]|nr:MAG: zinc ribbon domain-containing protein [Thermoplasmata archaeon]